MQKALENPDYKKIWEKVMMNRHPEVKSLEEALKMEAHQDGCLFYNTEKNMYGLNIADNTFIRYTPLRKDYGFCSHKNTDFTYPDQGESYNWQYGYNFEILGRPITLEDILILLSNLKNDNKITMQDIDIAVKNTYILPEKKCLDNHCICIEIIKYLEQEDGDEDEEMIYLYFDIVKPLHEQTSQVWENISKLID